MHEDTGASGKTPLLTPNGDDSRSLYGFSGEDSIDQMAELDDNYLAQVDRIADRLGQFTETSIARNMGSSASSGSIPPRPVSKDLSTASPALPSGHATSQRKAVPSFGSSILLDQSSGSAVSSASAAAQPATSAVQTAPAAHLVYQNTAPLTAPGAMLVDRGLVKAPWKQQTQPSTADPFAKESSIPPPAPEQRIKRSIFGSLRRKGSKSSKAQGTSTPKDETPKQSPKDAQTEFPHVAIIEPEFQAPADQERHNRLASISSFNSETLSSPGLLDAGFAEPVHVRAEHSDALAPDTFAILHRYSQALTRQESNIPGVPLAAIESPPRTLLRAVPVFQVVTVSGIKDRFLFLFNDLLVVAKPVSPPATSASGQGFGMADLKWTFSAKAILELRSVKLSIPRDHTEQLKPHPLMRSLIARFPSDPDGAISDVMQRSGMPSNGATIAQLLLQTPDLDKDALTAYLCDPAHRTVMLAFLSSQRFTGVSIESALRALLLAIRFPKTAAAFEHLLDAFARRWTETNSALIKAEFTAELAVHLVFAMVQLNDSLHGDDANVIVPGYFAAPNSAYSRDEFLQRFRQTDAYGVLSDQTLLRIYASIRSEPLAQSLSSQEGKPLPISLVTPLPSKLPYGQASAPISVSIPKPDRDFAIRLYGQDITFDPPILVFSGSNTRSFTMTSKTLGAKHIVFVRAGRNSRFYHGTFGDGTEAEASRPLPRSATIVVERAFMQNTFTVSAPGAGTAARKRFLFSVEDSSKRAFVTDVLAQRIEAAKRNWQSMPPARRATEAIAMQALRDALIDVEVSAPPSSVQHSQQLQRSASASAAARSGPPLSEAPVSLMRATSSSAAPASGSNPANPAPSRGFGSGLRVATLKQAFGGFGKGLPSKNTAPSLDRQTSHSKHYYAPDGAGRHERDLQPGGASGAASPAIGSITEDAEVGTFEQRNNRLDGETSALGPLQQDRVKTGQEIVTVCQQNSLLPLVLAHLKK